jgi:protease-4
VSLESDLLIDRGRLKRHLVGWRVVAILALLGCVLIGLGRASSSSAARPYIARVVVSGLITDNRDRVSRLEAVAGDPLAKALIVDIDSPGGSVAGGESLHDAIAGVAARKPVVALMRGVAASAGYMIAVPASRIICSPATLTGSIGVLLPTFDFSGLLGKLGVDADALVSGPLKDQPSFTKPLSDQGRVVLQGIVMDLYDQFVGMVAQGRHMSPDAVRKLADGRAYTGRQALALGLVDQFGGEAATLAWLASQGVPAGLPVRTLKSADTWRTWLLGGSTRGLLGAWLGKSLYAQDVVDSAWSVWQP